MDAILPAAKKPGKDLSFEAARDLSAATAVG